MKVHLKNVRLAFPALWDPRSFQGGDPRYEATFLFSPDHDDACKVFDKDEGKAFSEVKGAKAAVQQAIRAVAQEQWKDKAQQVLDSIKGNPNKFCLRDGSEKAQYDGYEGNLFVKGGSPQTKKPKIYNVNGEELMDKTIIYAGCYVVAVLDIWAQSHSEYGKGIRASLLGVQYLRHGDAFSAGTSASEEDFEDLSDGADAPDLTDEPEQTAAGGLI